jgi:predicted Fe-Mo cluster-binding NifX family protein
VAPDLLAIESMKVAIPYWQDRVSPVFDVAGNLLLIEMDDGTEQRRETTRLGSTEPGARAKQLAGTGADVLVCGAISRPLEAALVASGVRVIPQICGQVEEVLAAFLKGRLTEEAFLMPGVRLRRRSRNRGRRRS